MRAIGRRNHTVRTLHVRPVSIPAQNAYRRTLGRSTLFFQLTNDVPLEHAAAAVLVGFVSSSVAAQTQISVQLSAQKDATLTQATQEMGSGTSDGIFAGRVGSAGGGLRRRGLIKFDIAAAVPRGATIVSAQLTMQMVQTTSGPKPVALHRASADWGEGPSFSPGGQGMPAQPGDATWVHRVYPDLPWNTLGGDYVTVASASIVVDGTAPYSWRTSAMAGDVQSWLDDASSNFGWLIRGQETTSKTVKKFASRESLSPDYRPRLDIVYVACAIADLDCDHSVDSADLGVLLGEWGGAGDADLDGDGVVGPSDLAILLGAWT